MRLPQHGNHHHLAGDVCLSWRGAGWKVMDKPKDITPTLGLACNPPVCGTKATGISAMAQTWITPRAYVRGSIRLCRPRAKWTAKEPSRQENKWTSGFAETEKGVATRLESIQQPKQGSWRPEVSREREGEGLSLQNPQKGSLKSKIQFQKPTAQEQLYSVTSCQ